MHRRLALGILILAGCSTGGPPPGTACNGHDELCARRYDAVAFPGTHDAYSNREENFGAPDQSYPIARQLADGVRVVHLEIQPFDGDVYVCHAVCQVGAKRLADVLDEVLAFHEAHPREVVTLLMEQIKLTTADIAQVIEASGLQPRLRAQDRAAPWPTLGELIDARTPIVAFLTDVSAADRAAWPWLLDRWTTTWETPWDNESAADFGRCDVDRGDASSAVYVVDTYWEDEVIPTPEHARSINTNPFLIDRLLRCQAFEKRLPNFVMVNYYEVGDLFADVDVLNGFRAVPGDDLDAFPPAPSDGGATD